MLHRTELAAPPPEVTLSSPYPDVALSSPHPEAVRAAPRQPEGGPARALAYLYLFRRVVVALALLGAGVAWASELPWLAAAGLAIATGEWLRSTYYIGVLSWGHRHAMVGDAGPAVS